MIIFFVMILLLVVFILLDDDSAIAQTEPPTEGDWIISDITLKTETSISLNGSIIVLEGGTLTLDNIRINFNCEWDGQYGINIHTGGKLNLYDSNIEPDNYQYSFKFEVYGSMDMNNSSVYYLWGGDFSKLDVRIGGIMVFSDDVKILNSTISRTYGDGITCIKSSPTIMYNTIKNAGDDGISCNFSSPKIIGNLIEDNHLGIYIYNDSAPLVRNNNIKRTTYDYFSKGISITHSNRMIIENNTINNFYHGIRIKHSSPYAIYNNSLIDCGLNSLNSSPKISNILIDGADYGVYCDDYSNVTILDSKIINSGQYDIYLYTNSHSIVTLINTSVDKVFITQGSSIISKWYVHVNVQESSGNIVSNAKITVKDLNDHILEHFYFTDATGWVYKIVCTESIQYSNSEIRYTPHTICANKNGTGSNITIEEINDNKWLILVLQPDSD